MVTEDKGKITRRTPQARHACALLAELRRSQQRGDELVAIGRRRALTDAERQECEDLMVREWELEEELEQLGVVR